MLHKIEHANSHLTPLPIFMKLTGRCILTSSRLIHKRATTPSFVVLFLTRKVIFILAIHTYYTCFWNGPFLQVAMLHV